MIAKYTRFSRTFPSIKAAVVQVLGSPIGAYLLLHLDAAHLQLSIAAVLTLVFISMVVSPAQGKQIYHSIRNSLSRQNQTQHAQHEGYSALPPTPRLGPMQDTPKSFNTELSQAKTVESLGKVTDDVQNYEILKPTPLPAAVLPTSSRNSSSISSSSLGSLAPQAPPPINIHPVAPPVSSQLPLESARSTWSIQNSNPAFSRRGSLTAASFDPETLRTHLDAESGASILARRHSPRKAPPVVRISHNSMDLLKQDVQSYHSSSPAMSWMRRLQPDCSTVVINYPLDYDWDDMESGRSLAATPAPTPTPTCPSSPQPDLVSGNHLVNLSADGPEMCCCYFLLASILPTPCKSQVQLCNNMYIAHTCTAAATGGRSREGCLAIEYQAGISDMPFCDVFRVACSGCALPSGWYACTVCSSCWVAFAAQHMPRFLLLISKKG